MTSLGGDNYLPDLAARIRAEHAGALSAAKRSVEHAIAAGELLIEAKAQLKHGEWLPWLRDHCDMSDRTARAYTRVARNKDKLGEIGNVADLSLRGAIGALTEHLPPDVAAELAEIPPRPLELGEIELPINEIKFIADLYPRSRFYPDLVKRYSYFLRTLPAIEVNQRNELIDGWHRLEAYRQSDAKTIRVRVTSVESELDHLKRAVAANSTHGEQLPLDVEIDVQRKKDAKERLQLSLQTP